MAQPREIIPNEGMLLLEETNEKCANEKHCRDLAGSIMVPGYKYLMFRGETWYITFCAKMTKKPNQSLVLTGGGKLGNGPQAANIKRCYKIFCPVWL